jgi:cytochrome c peroxidase
LRTRTLVFPLLLCLALSCTGRSGEARPADAYEPPLGLPEIKVPEDNPMTPEKIGLGKQLFFDRRLSKDGTASCETCHVHEKGWTDGLPLSKKVGGAMNTRHTPTLYNVAYLSLWYWDGRAATLEKQIEAAWKAQMGADPAEIAKRIAGVKGYAERFRAVFGSDPTPETIVKALATFVRTLNSGNSPWDRYERGDEKAVSPDAVKGYEVFTQKAQCSLCHAPPTYFDTLFHNVGIGMDRENPDLGRGAITKDPKDAGAFKTPGLRSVTKSAPYFHDGSVTTLEEAVRIMLRGGFPNANLDPKLKPHKITDEEFRQLMAFLEALESDESFERPTLPE